MKFPTNLKLGDVVYIEFDDHCTDAKAWVNYDDGVHSICMVKVAGFVLKNDPTYLTVCLMLQKDNKVFSNQLTIVKSCIRKIKRLKYYF